MPFRSFRISASMASITIGFAVILHVVSPLPTSLAGSELSPHQDVPLDQVQDVYIETLALTEKGSQKFPSLPTLVGQRLAAAGFTPVYEQQQPHDITVRVKCEEHTTWNGPSRHRQSSHSATTTSRLWKGPSCLISYRYQGKAAQWSRQVRTPFEDSRKAAKDAGAPDAGLHALQALQSQLTLDEFPLYLAAEWKQTERLAHLFQQQADDPHHRRLILELLGTHTSPIAFSTLKDALQDPSVSLAAIHALGYQGEVAIPMLSDLLKTSKNTEHRLAALRSLGEIATHSKHPGLYDQFLGQLQSNEPRLQTVAVRGLGKLGDQRALAPLETLNLQTWTNPTTSTDFKALREALNWSLWQLNPDAHTGE